MHSSKKTGRAAVTDARPWPGFPARSSAGASSACLGSKERLSRSELGVTGRVSMTAEPVTFVWPGDLHLESEDRPNYKTALWMADEVNELIRPDFVQFAGDNVQYAKQTSGRCLKCHKQTANASSRARRGPRCAPRSRLPRLSGSARSDLSRVHRPRLPFYLLRDTRRTRPCPVFYLLIQKVG